MTTNTEFSFVEKTLAWSVHAFTASGLVAGFMAILAVNAQNWKVAFLWLVACLVIDGIDGTFARLFKVKEVLPYINGTTIDYVIDFATYAIIPAYIFHQFGLVSDDWNLPCTALILLVSALYYGKEGMVSDDMYFVGFPVMWNMVVFYQIFVWQLSPMVNVFVIIFFAVLHFVPVKFVYPSRATKFKGLTIGVTVIFILTLILILYCYPEKNLWLSGVAIATALYYGIMAIYNTWVE